MKYLIQCGPGIGDIALILPMLRIIKKNDADAYIQLFTQSNKKRMNCSLEMFELQVDANKIDYYNFSEMFHTLKFFVKIFIKGFDYGFIFHYTDRKDSSLWPTRIARMCAKRVVGIEMTQKTGYKFDITIPRNSKQSYQQYYLEMVRKIGYKDDMGKEALLDWKKIKRNTISYEFKGQKYNKRISLCVGTAPMKMKIQGKLYTSNAKNWPYSYWIKLAELLAVNNWLVFLVGGQKEREEIVPYINRNMSENIINYLGKTSISESIEILAESDFVVGGETGLMHVAGALGIPSLTLFGCTDYHNFLSYTKTRRYIIAGVKCYPCFGTNKAAMCVNNICMKRIKVIDVYNKIVELSKNNI